MALSDPIVVYTAQSNLDAILIQRFLESHDVEAFAVEDNSLAGYWVLGTLPGIHKPQVWVQREDSERAGQLLIEYEQLRASRDAERKTNEPKTIAVHCEHCGRKSAFAGSLDGSVQDCPHCGSYVDVEPFDGSVDDSEESDSEIGGAWQPVRDEPDESQSTVVPVSAQRAICVEVVVVLCLGVFPQIVDALYYYLNPDVPYSSFVWDQLIHITMCLQITVPLLYIISKSSDSWSTFAITRFRPFFDSILGLALFPGLLLISYAIAYVGSPLDTNSNNDFTFPTPVGFGEHWLLLAALLVNSVSEELLVRAYLITRLRHLGLSAVAAVFVSSALWAAYHIYQGTVAALEVFALGLVYGALFVLLRRVWPLVITHTLYNLWVYALATAT